MKKLVLFALLALNSCGVPECDNLVIYDERRAVIANIQGEYEFIGYAHYSQISSTCDCVREANYEARRYNVSLDTMPVALKNLHLAHPSYFQCI